MQDTERALIYSYLLGFEHASGKKNLADDAPDAVSFDEAIRLMKSSIPLTKDEWNALEPQLRYRAFTVARLAEVDSIEAVKQKLISVLQHGGTVESFWSDKGLQDIAGVSSSRPWYWETVYRTNIQTAYNAGRAVEFKDNQPPYLEFVGIEDSRQTEICAERSGVVRPASDPWWNSNWPPLHFNCRSTVRGVYRDEIEGEDALSVTNHDDLAAFPKAAGGFGSNPIETGSYWRITKDMEDRAKSYGIWDDFEALRKDLGLADDVWPDYKRAVKQNAEGGFVDLSDYHGKNETAQNLQIASTLAAEGHRVRLLPRNNSLPSADAVIDGQTWEFKRVSNPTTNAIDSALRAGKKQADRIYLVIAGKVDRKVLKGALRDRVARSPNIELVRVVVGGMSYDLPRSKILAGDFGF